MRDSEQEAGLRGAGPDAQITQLLEDARRRLVETGSRNRLIHVNRLNTRGPILNLINERAGDVYAALAASKSLRFSARGKDKTSDSGEESLALPDPLENVDPSRFVDQFLETPLGPDGLQKKLLSIHQQARTAEEEQGVNILYLAIGFLIWYEDETSSIPRSAPLILLPADLVRNERTSTFDLRLREEDIVANLPLSIRLKSDFGIRLPDLEVDEDWKPADYFELVAAAITPFSKWGIERDVMQLGFFSFSKLLMYQDLSPDSWPDGSVKRHPLTRALLFEGFAGQPKSEVLDGRLDSVLPPAKLFHVVDADASQAVAIEEARIGRSLVIQGPPGTGKSQTICNIIATAVREGKTVLFVAEKMAALSVVHDRLVKVGLRDVCLELHSKAANKRTVIAELGRTLDAGQSIPRVPGEPVRLTASRDKLNEIADTLHQPIGLSGETPLTVLARQAQYLGMGFAAPRFTSDQLLAMGEAEEEEACEQIDHYGKLVAEIGRLDAHPLGLMQRLDMQPTELHRAAGRLEEAIPALEELKAVLDEISGAVGVSVSWDIAQVQEVQILLQTLASLPNVTGATLRACLGTVDRRRLREALEIGQQWRRATGVAQQHFVEQAFDVSLLAARAGIARGCKSLFVRLGGRYRQASSQLEACLSGPLPSSAKERLALVDELLSAQVLRNRFREEKAFCAQSLGPAWQGERTDFAELQAVLSWLSSVERLPAAPPIANLLAIAEDRPRLKSYLTRLEQAAPKAESLHKDACRALSIDPSAPQSRKSERASLREAVEALRLVRGHLKDYPTWARAARIRQKLHDLGLDPILNAMHDGTLATAAAVVELRFARAEQLWQEARRLFPLLEALEQADRHEWVREFADLERQHLRENVTRVHALHREHMPSGAQGEMKIVRGEIAKKRKQMPLRKLMNSASHAIQRIKPVFLMSPISVAQFLQPGGFQFDLLVIDEASQIRPEDALGAVARAGQVIVVGDPRQLPPSSFFDRLVQDEEAVEDPNESSPDDLLEGAAKLEEMESILTLCQARGLGRKMLKWHYRSKDPSLMEVSNAEFYNSELVLFPSPFKSDNQYGMCYTLVPGVYDRGGKRDNRIEGEAVVARLAEHARNHPDWSLGVATFSAAQRNTITELLELARRKDKVLDGFLREGPGESVFVKNIENIQGDERDVILVSVCYGPPVAGGHLTSQSFGPVNGEGGERRLNVLFTRARLRCEVFASFEPSDIDLTRARGEGVRVLKRYLDFARTGNRDQDLPTGEDADSALEQDVAGVIRGMGFLADPQVGSMKFRIDIGVRHPSQPGRYVLAVECDGATYHHALWARERDRLRQEVLEHLGWRFHRIWSTDWFYHRVSEVERLRAALAVALDEAPPEKTAQSDEYVPESLDGCELEDETAFKGRRTQVPLYVKAVLSVASVAEPHEADPKLLEATVTRIILAEGPIHEDEVARRVATCFGKERAGARIMSAVSSTLRRAARQNNRILTENRFWFTEEQRQSGRVRDRSQEEGPVLKAEYLCLFELQAALELARKENGGGSDEELIRAAARYLGFRRLGSDLRTRIRLALKASPI
jgi:hypothetical protein